MQLKESLQDEASFEAMYSKWSNARQISFKGARCYKNLSEKAQKHPESFAVPEIFRKAVDKANIKDAGSVFYYKTSLLKSIVTPDKDEDAAECDDDDEFSSDGAESIGSISEPDEEGEGSSDESESQQGMEESLQGMKLTVIDHIFSSRANLKNMCRHRRRRG